MHKTDTETDRIKIAEACGWKDICQHPQCYVTYGSMPPFPSYLNDLNAIQGACDYMCEKHGMQWQVKFNHNLYKVLGHHDHVEQEAIHATAKQRCEAFILTIEVKKNENLYRK